MPRDNYARLARTAQEEIIVLQKKKSNKEFLSINYNTIKF